jgi:UDP-GlcNAc:undecaprenyl-phosphate GlcNAc-1-phosphate transferase
MQSSLFFLLILLVLNFLIIKYHERIFKLVGIFDHPDSERKIHLKPISLSGGLILLINFILAIIFLDNEFGFKNNFLIIFFSILFYLVGYFDDKNDIRPLKKTLLNIFLIFIFLFLSEIFLIENIRSNYFDNLTYLEKYNFIFTIFCFIAFLNALNMYDGINGQSGIFLIFLFIYLFIFSNNHFFFSIIISLIFFLYLNIKNKCFIGNSGINFISFIILIFFVDNYNDGNIKRVEDILILMLFPGIEMARLFFFRMLVFKSPFEADKKHIHHLLLNHIDSKKVVIITFILSILPLTLYNFLNYSYWSIVYFILIYFFIIGFLKFYNREKL